MNRRLEDVLPVELMGKAKRPKAKGMKDNGVTNASLVCTGVLRESTFGLYLLSERSVFQ